MCKVKSMIVFKDRVYCAEDTDSHCEMLEKLNIKDERKEPNFLRVEISPPEKEFFLPIDEWIYKVDQDYKPEWYVEEIDKARAFEVLKVWAESHIIINRSNFKIEGEGRFYIKNCKDVKACDSSSVEAYDSSSVEAYDSSSVTAYGSSSVKACDSSSVTACDSSSVTAYGSSSVKAYGSSSVKAYGSSSVKAYGSSSVMAYGSSSVTAYDSSSVTAYGSSSVTAYGSSSVTAYGRSSVTAYGRSSVKACDSSSVTACDSSSVTAYGSSSVTAPKWSSVNIVDLKITENATIKDCRTQTIYYAEDWTFIKREKN